MMKQAWRNYLASLHPRYLRKAYDKGGLFMLIYWFVIYPMIMNAVTENLEFYDVMALMFMRMVPFLIMGWSNIGSKYLMPKAMFLLPMKEEERKEYINCVLLIKIGMSVLLGICIEIIWGFFTGFHMGKAIIVLLANLSIGIAEYIMTEKNGINITVMTMEIVTMGIIACLEIGTEGSLTTFCNWYILITAIVLPILDIVIIREKYHATIALAGEYELAFKIEGKVEPKQVKFELFAK